MIKVTEFRNAARILSATMCLMVFPAMSLHAQTTGTSTAGWLPDDVFPITSWEALAAKTDLFGAKKNGADSLRDCGFNVAAFIRSEHVPLCEQLGMRALVAEGFPESQNKWAPLNDTQIEARVRRLIGNTAADKIVIGYFLEDEPGTSEFPALGKAVAAVKKLAPGKLAYINLFPDYAIVGAKDISQLEAASYDEYLTKYLEIVKPQFVSYDNYQVQYSMDQVVTATASSYYRNLLAVRKHAMAANVPFWNIAGSNQIMPQFPPPSPASLQLQAFTTLAAGAQGLSWYTYYSNGYQYAAVDTSGTRTSTWAYLKMVNDQVKVLGPLMRKLTSTGVYFTAPLPAPELDQVPGQVVESITADAPLMIGEFAGQAGEKLAMAVNLSLAKSSKINVHPKSPLKTVRFYSSVDGALRPLPPDGSVWLTAGQGVLLRLE